YPFGDELLGVIIQQITEMGQDVKLPSERAQAMELGVSRTALRDRLSSLESIGIVERRKGVGTFTKGLNPEAVRESLFLGMVSSGINLQSLRSVRIALERQAAVEAAQNDDYSAKAGMLHALEIMDISESSEALHAADIDFHKSVFAASKSSGLIFFSHVMRGALDPNTKLVSPHDKETMRQLHRNIATAIINHQTAEAAKCMDEHFEWLETVTSLE